MALMWDDQVQQMWNDNIKATNNKVLAGQENLDHTLFLCKKIEHNCNGYIERGSEILGCLCGCHRDRDDSAITRYLLEIGF